MNALEDHKITEAITVVLEHFPSCDRQAIQAHLLRAVYHRDWDWVAQRLGVDPNWAKLLARAGQRLLDRAIEAGQLSRDDLARDL